MSADNQRQNDNIEKPNHQPADIPYPTNKPERYKSKIWEKTWEREKWFQANITPAQRRQIILIGRQARRRQLIEAAKRPVTVATEETVEMVDKFSGRIIRISQKRQVTEYR
mgnify:CR=1 FL=1